jgi:putative IMPACT (imprinted ancient) family translation regulator
VLAFGYADTSLVMALFKEFDGEIVEQAFTDSCKIVFDLQVKQVKPFQSKIEILIATGYSLRLSQ